MTVITPSFQRGPSRRPKTKERRPLFTFGKVRKMTQDRIGQVATSLSEAMKPAWWKVRRRRIWRRVAQPADIDRNLRGPLR